jgi:pimeloyl-ACP methyl ester carboxylesterase
MLPFGTRWMELGMMRDQARPAPGLNLVDLPQGALTYRVVGPADSDLPPAVFVHGLFVDSQVWAGAADVLAQRGFRSYLPNWPTGSHPIPMKDDADLSPRGIARMVLDFLTALDLNDVTLVGNDTGGAICQFAIDTDHARIRRLVLTNCDAFDLFPLPEFAGLVKVGSHAALIKPMLTALKATAIRHRKNVYGATFAGRPDPRITRSWIEPGLGNKNIRRDTAKLMSNMNPKDLLEVSTRFRQFSKPVRLVWGDADPFFSVSLAERLAAAFPDATLTLVPGGHTFVSMDFPEQVAAAIAE